MSTTVILSCPFCHDKGEYRDAPPNSTVRCAECRSIFRVPAGARGHKPGTVLKGEAIPRSRLKYVAFAVVLIAVAVIGYYVWDVYVKERPAPIDPFATVANLYPEDTASGALQRFLESWKMGNMKLMLTYCRPENRAMDSEKLTAMFGNYKLTGYGTIRGKVVQEGACEFKFDVEGEDTRTKSPVKGTMKPQVVMQEADGPDGRKPRWFVDINTAGVTWD